jgi:hypothetical protein
VLVPATSPTVTLTPEKGADCAEVWIDDVLRDSITIPTPAPGASIPVAVTGRTAAGTPSDYTITVKRFEPVTGITSSRAMVPEKFDKTQDTYTVTVAPTVSSVTVKAVKARSGVKSMTMNGKSRTSLTVYPKIGQTVPVTIAAVSSDGKSTVTYTVNVTREMLVSDIRVSSETCTPALAFNPLTLSYTVDIPADAEDVTVTPDTVPGNVNALTVTGAAPGEDFVKLEPEPCQSLSTTITAIGMDNKTKIAYKVTVKRAPIITGIAAACAPETGVTLGVSPSFDPARTSCTLNVPANAGDVTLTPAKADAAYRIFIGGTERDSVVITAEELDAGPVPVTVYGETAAGTQSPAYTITVKRISLVTNIKTNSTKYPLSPAFSAAASTQYCVTLDSKASYIKLYISKAPGVSVKINGKTRTSFTTPKLARNGIYTATIVATAADGVTKCTYTVVVKREY